MKTIWKFPLPIMDQQTVQIPSSSRVIRVGSQIGVLCMWAEVNDEEPYIDRTIYIRGTGHPLPPTTAPPYGNSVEYLGSADCGPFVWHVYGEVEEGKDDTD